MMPRLSTLNIKEIEPLVNDVILRPMLHIEFRANPCCDNLGKTKLPSASFGCPNCGNTNGIPPRMAFLPVNSFSRRVN